MKAESETEECLRKHTLSASGAGSAFDASLAFVALGAGQPWFSIVAWGKGVSEARRGAEGGLRRGNQEPLSPLKPRGPSMPAVLQQRVRMGGRCRGESVF